MSLLIAGRGELESQLCQLTATLGVQERVRFLGFRSDVPQVLSTLDCFVFPSLREGLPLALLEAMAEQLPVIAARVGGIPEVCGETTVGRLVRPGDVEILAEAMHSMAATAPAQLHEFGLNARRRALDQFSAERMIREYEELFAACSAVWSRSRQR